MSVTENCPICLEPARIKLCPANVCNMKCHRKCLKKYKDNGHFLCPQCRGVKIERNLRPNMSEKEIIRHFKIYLNDFENSIGVLNKMIVAKKMCEMLSKNKWFLEKHHGLYVAFKNKLSEFRIYWNEASKYHLKIYGEEIH